MGKPMVAFALAALAAAGCWGDVVSIYPDAGDTEDTDPGPPPELYPGGGVGGEPIDGHLNLYFFDEATFAPVAGVRVMIGDDPAAALTGETGADGLVAFHDPALAGTANVHALADGYVFESTLALAWTNATLPLRPAGAATGAATATVAGELVGWEALTEPGPSQYRVARVYYGETATSLLALRGRDFSPRGVDSAELALDVDGGAFSLAVPARPGALYAVAGVAETFGTPSAEDDVTDWVFIGVVGGLAPAPGSVVADVELDLDTPLSEDVEVAMDDVTGSFSRKDVLLGLDLGADGIAWLEAVRLSGVFAFAAPYPAAGFAEASPILVGAAEQEEAPDAGPFGDLPRSYLIDRAFTDWLGWNVMPWPLDVPPPGPVIVGWDGAAIDYFAPTGRSLGQVVVSDAATGAELWRATVWGDLPQPPLAYPALPAGWTAPAIPAAGIAIEMVVDELAEGTSEMLFDEFSSVVTSRVLTGKVFE